MIGDLFCCDDYRKRYVCLTLRQWVHILHRRPHMANCDRQLQSAIKDPDVITADREHPNRECFYRMAQFPDATEPELVKLVIGYMVNEDDVAFGNVITAYWPLIVHPGEKVLWTRR